MLTFKSQIMKTLIYISTGILIAVMLYSCHPDQTLSMEDPKENILQSSILSAKSDSIEFMETDPPKDRDHWRPDETNNHNK